MPKETMTSRERWLAVLQRKKPDRVPMDYWATAEATDRLCKYLGCNFDEAIRQLHMDIPLPVWGHYVGPKPKDGTDLWGLRRQGISYGTGVYHEVINAPLAAYNSVEEIEANYRWPSPDYWDYSHIPERVKGKEDRCIRGGGSEPFLLYCQLRGLEQAFQDLVEHPDIVEYCIGKLFDLAYEDTRRIFETIPGQVTICYVA